MSHVKEESPDENETENEKMDQANNEQTDEVMDQVDKLTSNNEEFDTKQYEVR